MEKEVQETGCPTSTVPGSPRSRTWLQFNVKGRYFMRPAKRSPRTKSSLCGMETAMKSFWTFPWACRWQNRGSRRLGPLKVSAHPCLTSEALLGEGHLPAASGQLVELPSPPKAGAETKLRVSLTRGHYPAGGPGPHLPEAAEAASIHKDPFSCTPSPSREDNKSEINGHNLCLRRANFWVLACSR